MLRTYVQCPHWLHSKGNSRMRDKVTLALKASYGWVLPYPRYSLPQLNYSADNALKPVERGPISMTMFVIIFPC